MIKNIDQFKFFLKEVFHLEYTYDVYRFDESMNFKNNLLIVKSIIFETELLNVDLIVTLRVYIMNNINSIIFSNNINGIIFSLFANFDLITLFNSTNVEFLKEKYYNEMKNSNFLNELFENNFDKFEYEMV